MQIWARFIDTIYSALSKDHLSPCFFSCPVPFINLLICTGTALFLLFFATLLDMSSMGIEIELRQKEMRENIIYW